MAVIEEQSNGDDPEKREERAGEKADVDSVVEGIASLEIVTSVAVEGAEDEEGEEDDDDDDVVWGGSGLRGFVQKAEEPWKISRQYFPSKAGGAPAWLDPTNLPKGQQSICGICDKPLRFVLQVYAPAEDDDAAFHRSLFVFMCTSLACLQQDELQQIRKENRSRSVKVFRSQLPRENPFYSWSAPRMDGLEPLVKEGAPLCSWCGAWKGDKLCAGCKQARYCCQLHQMDHWRGDHAPHCRRVQEQLKNAPSDIVTESAPHTATAPSRDAGATRVGHPSSVWPEFELIVDETGGEDDYSEDNPDSRAGTGAGRLLADYERRRRQGGEFSARDVQDVEESSLEEQHWAFFQAKISKSPDQILWYLRSAEAKPLWPRLNGQPKESDIPACPLCGGERTFEFQILPQLLYFFGVQDNPDSLDWGTIAVYSCARSCSIQGYCEEFAWVQPGFT